MKHKKNERTRKIIKKDKNGRISNNDPTPRDVQGKEHPCKKTHLQ